MGNTLSEDSKGDGNCSFEEILAGIPTLLNPMTGQDGEQAARNNIAGSTDELMSIFVKPDSLPLTRDIIKMEAGEVIQLHWSVLSESSMGKNLMKAFSEVARQLKKANDEEAICTYKPLFPQSKKRESDTNRRSVMFSVAACISMSTLSVLPEESRNIALKSLSESLLSVFEAELSEGVSVQTIYHELSSAGTAVVISRLQELMFHAALAGSNEILLPCLILAVLCRSTNYLVRTLTHHLESRGGDTLEFYEGGEGWRLWSFLGSANCSFESILQIVLLSNRSGDVFPLERAEDLLPWVDLLDSLMELQRKVFDSRNDMQLASLRCFELICWYVEQAVKEIPTNHRCSAFERSVIDRLSSVLCAYVGAVKEAEAGIIAANCFVGVIDVLLPAESQLELIVDLLNEQCTMLNLPSECNVISKQLLSKISSESVCSFLERSLDSVIYGLTSRLLVTLISQNGSSPDIEKGLASLLRKILLVWAVKIAMKFQNANESVESAQFLIDAYFDVWKICGKLGFPHPDHLDFSSIASLEVLQLLFERALLKGSSAQAILRFVQNKIACWESSFGLNRLSESVQRLKHLVLSTMMFFSGSNEATAEDLKWIETPLLCGGPCDGCSSNLSIKLPFPLDRFGEILTRLVPQFRKKHTEAVLTVYSAAVWHSGGRLVESSSIDSLLELPEMKKLLLQSQNVVVKAHQAGEDRNLLGKAQLLLRSTSTLQSLEGFMNCNLRQKYAKGEGVDTVWDAKQATDSVFAFLTSSVTSESIEAEIHRREECVSLRECGYMAALEDLRKKGMSIQERCELLSAMAHARNKHSGLTHHLEGIVGASSVSLQKISAARKALVNFLIAFLLKIEDPSCEVHLLILVYSTVLEDFLYSDLRSINSASLQSILEKWALHPNLSLRKLSRLLFEKVAYSAWNTSRIRKLTELQGVVKISTPSSLETDSYWNQLLLRVISDRLSAALQLSKDRSFILAPGSVPELNWLVKRVTLMQSAFPGLIVSPTTISACHTFGVVVWISKKCNDGLILTWSGPFSPKQRDGSKTEEPSWNSIVISLENGRPTVVISDGTSPKLKIASLEPIEEERWHFIGYSADQTGKQTLNLFVNGQRVQSVVAPATLKLEPTKSLPFVHAIYIGKPPTGISPRNSVSGYVGAAFVANTAIDATRLASIQQTLREQLSLPGCVGKVGGFTDEMLMCRELVSLLSLASRVLNRSVDASDFVDYMSNDAIGTCILTSLDSLARLASSICARRAASLVMSRLLPSFPILKLPPIFMTSTESRNVFKLLFTQVGAAAMTLGDNSSLGDCPVVLKTHLCSLVESVLKVEGAHASTLFAEFLEECCRALERFSEFGTMDKDVEAAFGLAYFLSLGDQTSLLPGSVVGLGTDSLADQFVVLGCKNDQLQVVAMAEFQEQPEYQEMSLTTLRIVSDKHIRAALVVRHGTSSLNTLTGLMRVLVRVVNLSGMTGINSLRLKSFCISALEALVTEMHNASQLNESIFSSFCLLCSDAWTIILKELAWHNIVSNRPLSQPSVDVSEELQLLEESAYVMEASKSSVSAEKSGPKRKSLLSDLGVMIASNLHGTAAAKTKSGDSAYVWNNLICRLGEELVLKENKKSLIDLDPPGHYRETFDLSTDSTSSNFAVNDEANAAKRQRFTEIYRGDMHITLSDLMQKPIQLAGSLENVWSCLLQERIQKQLWDLLTIFFHHWPRTVELIPHSMRPDRVCWIYGHLYILLRVAGFDVLPTEKKVGKSELLDVILRSVNSIGEPPFQEFLACDASPFTFALIQLGVSSFHRLFESKLEETQLQEMLKVAQPVVGKELTIDMIDVSSGRGKNNLLEDNHLNYWESKASRPHSITISLEHCLATWSEVLLKTHDYGNYSPQNVQIKYRGAVVKNLKLSKRDEWCSLLKYEDVSALTCSDGFSVVIEILVNYDGGCDCRVNCIRLRCERPCIGTSQYAEKLGVPGYSYLEPSVVMALRLFEFVVSAQQGQLVFCSSDGVQLLRGLHRCLQVLSFCSQELTELILRVAFKTVIFAQEAIDRTGIYEGSLSAVRSIGGAIIQLTQTMLLSANCNGNLWHRSSTFQLLFQLGTAASKLCGRQILNDFQTTSPNSSENQDIVVESNHPSDYLNESTFIPVKGASGSSFTLQFDPRSKFGPRQYFRFYEDDSHTKFFGLSRYYNINLPGLGSIPPLHIPSSEFVIGVHHSDVGMSSSGTTAAERGLVPGSKVRIRSMPVEEAREIQSRHGGFATSMASMLGKLGTVVRIDGDGDVVVSMDGTSHSKSWGPVMVELVEPDGERLRVGESCVVSSDFESVDDAGGGPLRPGDVGTVANDDLSDKPFLVRTSSGATWWYRPGALRRYPTRGMDQDESAPVDSEAWGYRIIATPILNDNEITTISLESNHPYDDGADEWKPVEVPGATSYLVAFDARTKTEAGCDFIRFCRDTSSTTTQFGEAKYTGGHNGTTRNFPGTGEIPQLLIPCSKFFVHFHSDNSVNDWGYKMTIKAIGSSATKTTAVKMFHQFAHFSDLLGRLEKVNLRFGHTAKLWVRLLDEAAPSAWPNPTDVLSEPLASVLDACASYLTRFPLLEQSRNWKSRDRDEFNWFEERNEHNFDSPIDAGDIIDGNLNEEDRNIVFHLAEAGFNIAAVSAAFLANGKDPDATLTALFDMQSQGVNQFSSRETVEMLDPADVAISIEDSVFEASLRFVRVFNSLFSKCFAFIDLTQNDSFTIGNRLSRCRQFLLASSKDNIFREALASSQVAGDPFELVLSRSRAIHMSSQAACDLEGRWSIFGQAFRQIHPKPAASLRQSRQLWKVLFAGERSQDAGGPYRESWTLMCQELMNCSMLPLLRPCPNASESVGTNRDGVVLNSQSRTPEQIQMFEFLGKLIGCAARTGNFMDIVLTPLTWKQIVKELVSWEDYEEIASHDSKFISDIQSDHSLLSPHDFDSKYGWLEFAIAVGGDTVSLSKEHRNVCHQNALKFVDAFKHFRLGEGSLAAEAVHRGLSTQLPVAMLRLITGKELERMVCGDPEVDIGLLRSVAQYSSLRESDDIVVWLWAILEEFSQEDRRVFLRFVWGRSRLPMSQAAFTQKLRITLLTRADPDSSLPFAHTCFFSIDIPKYTSKDVMRMKLQYAMTNCTSIDGDDTSTGMRAAAMGYEEGF